MKVYLKNITSLFLAFLVLFSTMSLTINEHYCGDILVDITVFTNVNSCGMDMHSSETNSQNIITKNQCCNNEHIVKKGQDELNISTNSLSFDQQLFVASFIYSYINLFEGLDNKITPFKDYSPPIVNKDIQVLYQTFLI
ncbi:hypothetical protein MNBD_BACTEROID02-1455 [hydrothermal vent metagenome]|jgi:hypothetical protein|uniref:Secreted protein n=1 Tax=hydrothermal vent metagenome TaxID=652676 RepID=A0A3B0QPE1_9ZZZZ